MDGVENLLSRAIEVEEELANVLAKALESILLSVKADLSLKKKNKIIETLRIIQKDTSEHKAEVKKLINLLKGK